MCATKIVLALSSLCAVSVATQSNSYSAMCADPAQYSGSASSPVEGCCDPDPEDTAMAGCCTQENGCCGTPGPACAAVDWAAADCDSAGYWTCDGVADVYATSMGTTGWADCSTTIPSGSTSTWAETTFVARADARARTRGMK